jgi:hypothetical protein
MTGGDEFYNMTQDLLVGQGRPLYAYLACVNNLDLEGGPFARALDAQFPTRKLQGRTVTHTEWCIESVFPTRLYSEAGEDLKRMLQDKRLAAPRTFSAKDSWRSFFGYMNEPRVGIPNGWMDYMLRLWKVPRNRPMPHYYFDVTDPAWAFQELMANPKLVRSWRVSTACLMAWSFRWDSQTNCLHGAMLMRNMAWSHCWGEFYGGAATLRAIMKALKVPHGRLEIFSPTVTLDTPKQARAWVREVGE